MSSGNLIFYNLLLNITVVSEKNILPDFTNAGPNHKPLDVKSLTGGTGL